MTFALGFLNNRVSTSTVTTLSDTLSFMSNCFLSLNILDALFPLLINLQCGLFDYPLYRLISTALIQRSSLSDGGIVGIALWNVLSGGRPTRMPSFNIE